MTKNPDGIIILNCHCEPKGRACTPKCLPSPERFVQAGVTARRRGNPTKSLRGRPVPARRSALRHAGVALSRVTSLRSGKSFVVITPRNDLFGERGIG